jgi:Family of unknown function (DUF6527)
MKAETFSIVGTAGRYSEAAMLIKKPGDCAVVERTGVRRQILISCPDGCGETLSINLDPASGPAWHLYFRRGRWSLFPSIDRPTGCLSHFILWGGQITWCEPDTYGTEPDTPDIGGRILEVISPGTILSFVAIADQIDEVPWDVLRCCRRLVRGGLLTEGLGRRRGVFERLRSEE